MATHKHLLSTSRQQATCSLQQLRNIFFKPSSSSTEPSIPPSTTIEHLISSKRTTILYLAYGSNLSSETFRGNRGITPLSATNVHAPSLDLTFDLAGLPYTEPCFANTQYRHTTKPSSTDYHKDRWRKGLIGVVYEVTPEDYRTIIATEGGGASYQDVVVNCFPLAKGGKIVDPDPTGPSFRAHTLLCPRTEAACPRRPQRPDPSYAQASARYLKLITDGGEEHSLPEEYMAYLYNIRPYTITSHKQRIGQALFMGFWMPTVLALFGLGKLLADSEGKIPQWLANCFSIFFGLMWSSYDKGFKKVFGDGERTMEEKEDEEGFGGIKLGDALTEK